MIIYRHRELMVHPDIASWSYREASPAAVCHRLHDSWNHVGIGDPIQFDPGIANDWKDIGYGWSVAWAERSLEPGRDLARLTPWCQRVLPVVDTRERRWLAPVILTPTGTRAYPVAYSGANFLPAPTEDQKQAESIAREYRDMRLEAVDGKGIPVSVACRWAAFLLSITQHVSIPALAECGLMDDLLADRTLSVAAGLDERLTHARAT